MREVPFIFFAAVLSAAAILAAGCFYGWRRNRKMYREMLEDEGLDEETRKRFLGKMKGQSEKIDWILKSLFKMVNLEQGAVVFEAEPLPVRDTILDAVTAQSKETSGS